jgi:hypothetical protein
MTASISGGVMTAVVNNSGGIYYDPKITSGSVYTWVPGADYLLSFWAKASSAGEPINVKTGKPFDGDPYWIAQVDTNTAVLSASWSNYIYHITAVNKGYTSNNILFELGNLTNFPVTVYFSNVTMKGQ